MTQKSILFLVFGWIVLALAACSGQATPAGPAATLAPTPTITAAVTLEPTHTIPDLNKPGSTPQPGSPKVISRQPAMDQEARPDSVVELTFDQSMDQLSVQAAFHLKDAHGAAIGGQFSWPSPEHLRFTPQKPLDKGAYYQVALDETARADSQQFLGDVYSFRFKTTAPLLVSQVFPLDGADGVKVDGPITVIFNRPVTSLGVAEDQSKLPQPLLFSPELKGTGEWVNTSTYIFHPAQALSSGTRYGVTIHAGLKDASGSAETTLPSDYRWQFTTLKPMLSTLQVDSSVIDLTNLQAGVSIGLLPKIKLGFSQAMDAVSTAKSLTLLDANSRAVPVGVQWNADNRVLTLTPGRLLDLNMDYTLALSTGALANDGGALNSAFKWIFTTVPVPAVGSTFPADGSSTESTYYFSIAFTSPMRLNTIPGLVKITPALEGAKLDWYYNAQDKTAFFYGLKPSTTYTVTISPGMQDIYGNATRQSNTVRFTTAAATAQLYLNMPSEPLYRTDTPQMFFISATNIHALNVVVYKVQPGDLVGRKTIDDSQFDPKNLVAKFDFSPVAKPDQGVLSKVDIKTLDGKPLPPGAYFMGIDSKDITHTTRFIDGRYFLITDTFLVFKDGPADSLVWAVQPQTGKPISGQDLEVYSEDENHAARLLGSGKTDANGLLHVSFPASMGGLHYVSAPEGAPFTFASSSWSSEVSLDNFGIPNVYGDNAFNTTAYIYTDRPLYRPAQPVYFKGILRSDDDLTYRIPAQKEVEVIINSYDKEVNRQTLPVSASGTFNGQFQLDKEAALGNYSIVVQEPGQDVSKGNQSYGSLNFNVAEYRKPEFQVDLKADPANLLLGGSFTASVDASYYSGGPLDKADVSWTLRTKPFFYIAPDAYSAFSFTNPASDDEWFAYGNTNASVRVISQGQVQTDAAGKAVFKVPAVVDTSTDSQELNLETGLTDLSGNLVSSQVTVVAHRAAIYPGIRAKQYVGKAGEDQPLEVVVLDWDGKAVAKQPVSVAISERQWFSVQKQDAQGVLRWETNVKDIPVTTLSQVTDEKGLASLNFKPTKGGTYRAVVTVSDSGGRVNRSATYLWVAGSDYIPWRQTNDRTFQLITDRTAYNPGDQADVLIASPFQGDAYALVTVERGKIRQQDVLPLSSNSTIYHLPITADMGPAVYISVIVVKGVDKDNLHPTYKTGMTRINVSTDKKILQVDVTPDRTQAAPGEKVTYTIKTRDPAGKPLAAEVSLALSDLASLVLSDPNSAPINQYFYGMRGLVIQTVLSYTASIEEYNAHLNQMTSEGAGAGSGGKGGPVMGVVDVRQNFPDTAFWNAVVQTDESGIATVTVTLPDNLTTWRMDARAVTNDTLVGQTKVDILSTKQLLVRPQTPRFLIAGDQSEVSAAIHNDTGKDQTVTASLKAQGVTLQGSADQQVQIPAGKQALVSWKVTVPASSQRVDLVFSAAAGTYQDASTPPLGTLDNQGLPVYHYEAPETVGSSGEVDAASVRSELIHLPDWADVSQANLKVELEPSLAAGLTKGFDFLNTYPYDSTEVDISRFLPDVALLKALKSAGQSDASLQSSLEKQLNSGVQRLYTRQNSDGGWGWWSGSISDAMTSAYVLLGLAEAQDYGTPVDSTVLDNGKNYLTGQLNGLEEDKTLTPLALHNRQAFFLYVLTRNSIYQTNFTDKLFDQRNYLSLYARAFLAQTIWLQNNNDARLVQLRSELAQAAVLSASGASWHETDPDPWNWNTDVRSTAIILNAMITLDPNSELDANAVRWLMAHRSSDAWETTQENAWALMTLSRWLETSGELQGNYAYSVGLNGKPLGQGQVNSSNLQQAQTLNVDVASLLKDQANQLLVARSDGSGRLYYSTFLTVSLPVDQVKALDQGMTLTRRYYHPEDMKTPITQASAGDILEAELTITVPNSLHYVMITDPLPAGMEALDSSLKTSPQPTIPDGFDWSKFGEEGWGWWYFNHTELRDEKVVLFADTLPTGTYVYHYRVRAVTPGLYQVIPTTGQEVYFPDVYGRGEGSQFTIK
jgi:alpha-2-macroglobulin